MTPTFSFGFVTSERFRCLASFLVGCALALWFVPAGANTGAEESAPAAEVSADPANGASKAPDTATEDSSYRIGPGDLIEIKSIVDPNLDESVRVGPDGKIVHPLTGYIRVDGLTPEALGLELTRALSRTVRDPSITVFVREYAGRVVYVGGEVYHPQEVQILGKLTAMSAILAAGGYTPAGDLSKVVLLKRGSGGTASSRVIDLAALTEGEARGAADPQLAPFDMVIVPPTLITEIDRFVEQYITRVVPGNMTAGFSYVLGNQTLSTP